MTEREHPWYTDGWVGVVIISLGIAVTVWPFFTGWLHEREHRRGYRRERAGC